MVERAQHGDRDAFAAVLGSVGDSLYAVAYRILRDPDLAQDAFQEATIVAWRRFRTSATLSVSSPGSVASSSTLATPNRASGHAGRPT
jgi:DNA-directed RNA polymerase specialized sigma24 family protein